MLKILLGCDDDEIAGLYDASLLLVTIIAATRYWMPK